MNQSQGEVEKPQKKLSMKIYILPNLLTTANMAFGFYAILLAIKGDFEKAAYSLVIAAVFDLLDGRVARLTRATSKFGAEYDSLCDVISFGLAPAITLYLWALQPFERLGAVVCFLYAACGALRLARFNVQANVVEKAYFQGLPIPMAAGIIASSILAFQDLGLEPKGNPALLGMAVLLAFVMVSNFRYRSFKDLDLKQRMPFLYLVFGVTVLAFVIYKPEVHLFLLFLSYAVLGAVFGIFRLSAGKLKASPYSPSHKNMEPDLVEDDEGDDDEESAFEDQKK